MDLATRKGLTRESVAESSARRNEPDWLRQRRAAAWDLFEAAAWPDASQEAWRRVDLSQIKLEEYLPYAPADPNRADAAEQLPPTLRPANADALGGLVIQHNSEGAHAYLTADLYRQGVLFTSLDEAVRRYPELVESYLDRVAPPSLGKFEALHGALWSGGVFLYVPRNVELSVPLYASTWTDAPGLALFPRTLVVAEQGSRVTLYEEHGSLPFEGETFSSPVAEVWVGDGAQVRYTTIQRWGTQVREIGTRRVMVGRDARLEWVTAALGAGFSKMGLQAAFAGEGSESVLRGLYLPTGSQELHFDTLQDHQAAHTRSDLYFKGALRDAARAVYYGVIRVHPEAQQTNGYQQNRNLLLSDQAKADSIPILEIEANDVKCSHGATVGQVDPEQLFFLMSRGLPRPEAEQMLVEAFFREILDTIPDEGVREHVAEVIRERVSS